MSEPGEKPSLRFHWPGCIGLPATLRGIDVSAKWTRMPVSVLADGCVKRLFGNGCRQTAGSKLSHFAYGLCGSAAAAAPGASAAPTTNASTSERFISRVTEGAHPRLRLIRDQSCCSSRAQPLTQ